MTPDPMKDALSNFAIVGMDNGFDSHKATVMYRGRRIRVRIPSFIALGAPTRASLDGEEVDMFGYTTLDQDGNERKYHVGDTLDEILRTDKRGFATSPEGRVLFHHAVRNALHQLDYREGDPVFCFAGLPVQTYYLHDKRNDAVINATIQNLDTSRSGGSPVVPMGKTLGPMPSFRFIGCSAEAISSYFAYTRIIDPDTMSLSVNEERNAAKMVVVDFGGRTIDIVPINAGKPVFAEMDSIHDKGTIYLTRIFERILKVKRSDIEYIERLKYPDFRQGLMTGQLQIFNETVDVSQERDDALADYRDEIGQMLQQKLEGMTSFESIMFVGGPTELLMKGGLGRWAPRQMRRIELDSREDVAYQDAAFMNSDGLCVQALYMAREFLARASKPAKTA